MGLFTGLFQNEYPYTDLHELNLSWVIVQVKSLLDALKQIEGWIDAHQKEYEELKALYDAIVSGNFPENMKNALYDWTVENSASIIDSLTKMVFFGLTDDGYFCAYIPDTWNDIDFGTTGLDLIIPGVDYGHLVLSY